MPRGTETLLVRIEGRVQGVWFRNWTAGMAEKLALVGWVRNRADGSVEALFHGKLQDVLDMVEACKKGPPLAKVRKVTTERQEDPEGLTEFKQRPTR